MKHLKPFKIFEYKEPELYFGSFQDPVSSSDMTRYVLHISDPDNRDSILKNGLTPKLPGKKWQLSGRDFKREEKYWSKPSIYATLFKDSIDVYDVKNITDFVFPLMGIADYANVMSMDEFIEKNNLHYVNKSTVKGKFANLAKQEDLEVYDEKINSLYNKYLMKNAEYDIWIIDTEKAKNLKWFIDQPHYQEDSIYTTSKIPKEAIELLVPFNKPLVTNYIDESVKDISLIDLKISELVEKFEKNYKIDMNVYFSKNANAIIVSKIIVEKQFRNEGIGRKFMNELCALADDFNVCIGLTPSSDFGGAKGRLIKFYKEFEFKKYKGYAFKESMVREPRS